MRLKYSLARKTLLGAALGLLAAGLIWVLSQAVAPGIYNRFEAETLDLRYRWRIDHLRAQRGEAAIEEIVIVDIDERSMQKLGNFSQWPRTHHARLVDYLHTGGASVICFDILFMNRNLDRRADSLFADRVYAAGNVVNALAFARANPEAFRYVMTEPPQSFNAARYALDLPPSAARRFAHEDRFDGEFFELYNASAQLGFANFLADEDDAIRRMPLFMNFAGKTYPSLPLAVVMQAAGIDRRQIHVVPGKEVVLRQAANGGASWHIPIDNDGRVLINYAGSYQTFRYVSYVDVLEQRLPADFFRNKIVLVGTSAPGLYDLRVVPFQGDFPGVEIHANLIYSILKQEFLSRQSEVASNLTLAITGALIGVIAILLSPWLSILCSLVCGAAYAWFTFWAFTNRLAWIPAVAPVQVMVIALLLAMIYRYLNEEREKKLIFGMFGNYLSDNLMREILRNPNMLKLGGEHKYATAFFSDIKNFTTISEKLGPAALIQHLNEYLSAMTEIVLKYGGYLDKYEGDAIVAAFGAPVDQPDHAERACFAALDMQEELVSLHKKWERERRPLFEVRIGLNSGAMIAGNIGGKDRFDYTMIGDSVNLASRLEGVNKMYGTNIIISEETHELVKNKIIARELDFIRVKGKTKPVKIYELITRRDQGIGQEAAAIYTHYARGLEFYRQQQWEKAIAEFRRVLSLKKDGPALEMLRRCEVFLQAPRPKSWDGVFELQGK